MASIRKHRDKWQVRIRRAGLQPRSKSFAVRKDANEWARQMEVKADRAELPTDPKALQRITLAQLVVRYRDTVSVRKRGYENERISLTAFLKQPICSRRLSEIRTEDFAAYRDLMLQTIKPTSLKRYLDPIHNLFKVARHEWGLPMEDNPLDRLKLKAPSQRRERRLLTGEWELILKATRLCRNVWIEPIIRFALATGMRRGEILLIQQRHIDRERRTLLIPETKNGHSRTIPLSQEALALLHQFQEEGLLFPVSETRLRSNFLRTTPARKPRTECCCQSVTLMMAAIVVPLGSRSIAMMRAYLVSDCTADFVDRARGLPLLMFRAAERVAILVLDLGVFMRASELAWRRPPHHLSPVRAN